MDLLSTDNFFYRYNIENSTDLSESCYLRRQTKARRNNKKSFFFLLNNYHGDEDLLLTFLRAKARNHDVICLPPTNFTARAQTLSGLHLVVEVSAARDLPQLPVGHYDLLFSPQTTDDLAVFAKYHDTHSDRSIYWRFSPYNPSLKNSLTVKDICATNVEYKTIAGLEIINTHMPKNYELAPVSKASYRVDWTFQTPVQTPMISVIIPTFNNSAFLSNVIWHLINQNCDPAIYEIIVADDGSSDNSSTVLKQLFEKYSNRVNLTYIYWSKEHPLLGSQNFFRPGLARNLAAHYSNGRHLVFLDSDMLVPENFIEICRAEFEHSDVIQFQRFHIHQEVSRSNPAYKHIDVKKDTYIEEKAYWSELFFCSRWSDLPFYWKYTCTYALGLEKEKFYQLGLFKKYYISYGFEDTDLGYEAHKKGYRFSLVKTPLLHLTSYDLMQYKNSITRRYELLKVTAELFFLQHLNRDIYSLLGNFYRSQKSLKTYVRNFLR